MSRVWLPCGDYHQNYAEDQGWWQSSVIKGKMILLLLVVIVGFPLFLDEYLLGVANMISRLLSEEHACEVYPGVQQRHRRGIVRPRLCPTGLGHSSQSGPSSSFHHGFCPRASACRQAKRS